MWTRERDVVDYLLVAAVTALGWLHVPYRFLVYRRLHELAAWLQYTVDNSPEQVLGVTVVAAALVGGTFLAGLVRHASR